jgi:hypothetical protein
MSMFDHCRAWVAAACLAALVPADALAGGEPGYEPPPYYGEPLTMRAAAEACRVDIERYCVGVLPGGGRIISCLAGNRDRLTPPCADVLKRAEFFFRR